MLRRTTTWSVPGASVQVSASLPYETLRRWSVTGAGGFVSTVNVHEAGVGSFCLSLTANTRNVCSPSGRFVYVFGELQRVKDWLSIAHANDEPSWLLVKMNPAELEATGSGGPEAMVVSGGEPDSAPASAGASAAARTASR